MVRDNFKRKTRADPAAHAATLRRQIEAAKQNYEHSDWFASAEHDLEEYGLLLNVESEPDFPLYVESLEKGRSGIYLLNVRHRTGNRNVRYVEAAIFVPFGKLHILEDQIARYQESDGVKGQKLLANIRRIRFAALDALWTESEPLPPVRNLRQSRRLGIA